RRNLHTVTYNVSTSGSATASGTSPAKARRTLVELNRHRFGPAAKILLQGSETFPGGLVFDRNDRGTSAHPIVVASYGSNRPTIGARTNGIALRNTAGFLLQSL